MEKGQKISPEEWNLMLATFFAPVAKWYPVIMITILLFSIIYIEFLQ